MTPEQRWLMRCTVDASTPPICLPCWLRTEATGRSLRLPLAERLDCMTLAAEQCGSFRLFDRDDCGAGRVVNVHAAVARLNQIAAEESHDPETAHRSADAVLLAVAAPEVREAYELVGSSCGRWWFA